MCGDGYKHSLIERDPPSSLAGYESNADALKLDDLRWLSHDAFHLGYFYRPGTDLGPRAMTEGQGGPPLTEEAALEPLLCGSLIDRYEGESNDLGQPEVRAFTSNVNVELSLRTRT